MELLYSGSRRRSFTPKGLPDPRPYRREYHNTPRRALGAYPLNDMEFDELLTGQREIAVKERRLLHAMGENERLVHENNLKVDEIKRLNDIIAVLEREILLARQQTSEVLAVDRAKWQADIDQLKLLLAQKEEAYALALTRLQSDNDARLRVEIEKAYQTARIELEQIDRVLTQLRLDFEANQRECVVLRDENLRLAASLNTATLKGKQDEALILGQQAENQRLLALLGEKDRFIDELKLIHLNEIGPLRQTLDAAVLDNAGLKAALEDTRRLVVDLEGKSAMLLTERNNLAAHLAVVEGDAAGLRAKLAQVEPALQACTADCNNLQFMLGERDRRIDDLQNQVKTLLLKPIEPQVRYVPQPQPVFYSPQLISTIQPVTLPAAPAFVPPTQRIVSPPPAPLQPDRLTEVMGSPIRNSPLTSRVPVSPPRFMIPINASSPPPLPVPPQTQRQQSPGLPVYIVQASPRLYAQPQLLSPPPNRSMKHTVLGGAMHMTSPQGPPMAPMMIRPLPGYSRPQSFSSPFNSILLPSVHSISPEAHFAPPMGIMQPPPMPALIQPKLSDIQARGTYNVPIYIEPQY